MLTTLGLTKTVALEATEHGFTVNAICPGYVLTPLVEKRIPKTAKARNITDEQVIKDVLLHAQPPRKFVTPEIGAWPCSCAAMRPLRSQARRCRSTGAGLHNSGQWF